ncbi:MAG: hypothetical protein ACYSX0_04500 [Planctomycetota bacterium]|jgi:hypothetical protein
MLRYIATAAIAALLLVLAVKSRTPEAAEEAPAEDPTTVLHAQPEVSEVDVPGGVELHVKLCVDGNVSRASLVYNLQGKHETVDETTDCQKSLSTSSKRGDGYSSEVELEGLIPTGASQVRVVLEDETGTRIQQLRD